MRFFETFVALRMLRGIRRQKGFISLSSVFSIAGVAVGVMALIVVIAVMTAVAVGWSRIKRNITL